MIYTFVRELGAPTTIATLPSKYAVDASTLQHACAQFAKQLGLRVLEVDAHAAWFETADRTDVEYRVRVEDGIAK